MGGAEKGGVEGISGYKRRGCLGFTSDKDLGMIIRAGWFVGDTWSARVDQAFTEGVEEGEARKDVDDNFRYRPSSPSMRGRLLEDLGTQGCDIRAVVKLWKDANETDCNVPPEGFYWFADEMQRDAPTEELYGVANEMKCNAPTEELYWFNADDLAPWKGAPEGIARMIAEHRDSVKGENHEVYAMIRALLMGEPSA